MWESLVGGGAGACGEPSGRHPNPTFPISIRDHTVITGDGVTVVCGNHWGALHITRLGADVSQLKRPGWAPQGSSSPTPPEQEQPPSRVTTSLHMSPLSQRTAQPVQTRCPQHGLSSTRLLMQNWPPGARAPQGDRKCLCSDGTPHCREWHVGHSLTDTETGRRES